MQDVRSAIERNITLDKLEVHDHVAFFFQSDVEKEHIISRMLRVACDRGDACIFLISKQREPCVKRMLANAGIKQECLSREGRVAIVDPIDELDGGKVLAADLMNVLCDIIDYVADLGFTAVWVFTETDYLRKLLPEREFIIFESLSNEIFEEKNAIGICVIDVWGGKSVVMNSIMTHPTLVIKGYVCNNHFYMSPEECSRVIGDAPGMPFILEKLLEIQMSELNGIDSEEDLRALNAKLNSEIDRRRMVEWALLRSENDHRTAMNAISEMVLVTDRENKVLLVNDAFLDALDIIGYHGNVIGEDIMTIMPFLKKSHLNNFSEVIETGRTTLREGRFEVDGRELIFEVQKVPIMDGDKVGRVVTVIHDVTEQRRVNDELEKLKVELSKLEKIRAEELMSLREVCSIEQERRVFAEEKLIGLIGVMERSKVAIFVGDMDRHVVYANPACCDYMGYKVGEIEKVDFLNLFVQSERQMIGEITSSIKALGEAAFIAEACKKDGTNSPCALNMIRIGDTDGYMLVIMNEVARKGGWEGSISTI